MTATIIRLAILILAIPLLIALLPTSTGIPVEIVQNIEYVVNLARSFDWLFPITTLFHVLALTIGVELAIFLFKTLRWILHLITNSTASN